MRKPALVVLFLLALASPSWAGDEVRLEDFLPAKAELIEEIPRPSDVLGFEVGQWHVRPDQIVRYFELLAESSPRAVLEIQGQTHEGRPQPLLIVTSEANQQRLEEIRLHHLERLDPSREPEDPAELAEAEGVVFLGYSIHGNEASGANASLPVAYYLCASRDEEVQAWLDRLVILIDPSLNPDGLGRFAEWVNAHRGRQSVGDLEHRERHEPWPGGRTNHYWFDLNRDWLLAQHPESRARLRTFRRWRPNLLGDYHEMGGDATYFFQPGVPTRVHPLTPARNLELTRRLASFHAAALDRAGRLYYSEETFDDFYPGKGSTYPDLNGSVGVLFEQASTRGHLRQGRDRTQAFPFAIQNQALTSFSMIEGANALREELLAYQREFAVSALEEAASYGQAALALDFGDDAVRAHELLEVLRQHGIAAHRPTRSFEVDGISFAPETSWVVPYRQVQFRLIRALTERLRDFADSTFYDISSWSLPLAFGAREAELGRRQFDEELLGEAYDGTFPTRTFVASEVPYAYLFQWSDHLAPRALRRLQDAGWKVRLATRPFSAETGQGPREFPAGTLLVPAQGQAEETAIEGLLERIAREDGVRFWKALSGWTEVGSDFGGPGVRQIPEVHPLLVVGDGVSGYEAGEAWYLLDHHFGLEVPLIERDLLERLDLTDYTHLLLVDGEWDGLADGTVDRIREWVRGGGVVVATRGAAVWASVLDAEGSGEAPEGAADEEGVEGRRVAYADYESTRAAQLISGAIAAWEVDLTHPLFFGYDRELLPFFHRGTSVLEASGNPWENVAFYRRDPFFAGYASAENREKLGGSVAVIASRLGRGAVVRIAGNPLFRGFWHGSEKLYLSSIYFAPLLQETQAPEEWTQR